MKSLGKRQKLLLSALALAGLIWGVDTLTGGGPSPADARPTPAPTTAFETEWSDITPLIEQLTKRHTQPVENLDSLKRDLFMPTDEFLAAFPPPPEPENDQSPQEPHHVEASPVDFSSVHSLSGVMLGHTPQAVIDGHLLRIGDEIGGYRLIRIERDQVVFRDVLTAHDAILTIQPPGPS